MNLFPFTRNHLSPIEPQSAATSHRINTRQPHSFIPFKTTKLSSEEIPIDELSNELLKKCFNQIQCKGNQFKVKNQDRNTMIGKMSKVIAKFSFTQSSLCFAIQLMDIIKEKIKVKLNFEDIAIGSLIISIKYNENYNNICSFKSIQSSFELDLYYSNEQLRQIEKLCLNCIDYDLNLISPIIALEHIILRGIVFSSDFSNESINQIREKIENESRDLLEAIMKKTNVYIRYNVFLLSISIICYIRYNNNLAKWNEAFTFLYSISLKDIRECYIFIENIIPKSTLNHNNIIITSHYQLTMNTCNDLNSKYKTIKVNISSSLNELKLLSPSNYQKTIDSYNWKSQRSTSASLDETHLSTKYPVRTNYSHQNFFLNSTRSKSSNKKQVNLLYKPLKKFLSANIENKFITNPIKTEPVTVTQARQSQMNSYRNNNKKQIQNKVIKAFKKNSVLILESKSGKISIDNQTHRVYVKSTMSNNSKDMSNPSSGNLKQILTNRLDSKWNSYKKENNITVNSKKTLNKSSRLNYQPKNKGYQMLNKDNKLKPYVTLSNLCVNFKRKFSSK